MNPDKRIRRLQGLLYTSGVGTILFSLWSGIREIGNFIEIIKKISITEESEISEAAVKWMLGIFFFIIIFGTALLNLYIGRRAIAASLGKCRSSIYIVLAIIIVGFSFASYLYELLNHQQTYLPDGKDIVLFVIDFTSNIILAEVAVYSILLKKLRD